MGQYYQGRGGWAIWSRCLQPPGLSRDSIFETEGAGRTGCALHKTWVSSLSFEPVQTELNFSEKTLLIRLPGN